MPSVKQFLIKDSILPKYSGFLIAIEGIDGSGKSIQAKSIAKEFQSSKSVFLTQEPRKDKDTGKLCRKYLNDEQSIVEVDALIFAADRIEHYYQEILPKLQEGYLVITDRYYYSSYVYQHFSGVDLKWIKEINKYAPKPDLAVFIDIPEDVALKRLNTDKRTHLEKFEKTSILAQIRSQYQIYIDSNELQVVDGTQAPELVTKAIINLVLTKLPNS